MTDPGPSLVVLDPGPATTVQDMGRRDARRWGVPVAGTLAPDWLALANGLVGAPPDAAALELRLLGPRLRVEGGHVRLVLAGPADMRVESGGTTRTVPAFTATDVAPDDIVSVGPVRNGTVALLAVSGGIAVPPVLGSRATYVRAALGGLDGRALRANDRLPVGPTEAREPLALATPWVEERGPIRVILGPQDDHFTETAVTTFLEEPFDVTREADRMGLRLSGPVLAHRRPDLTQIVSDGLVPGAVQVPGSGAPIVLLADGQTVGGYPKIATVIGADLPRLARRAPGDTLRFRAVTVAEAETARHRAAAALMKRLAEARPATTGLDLRRLYEANLVDGVHAADG